MRIAVPTNGDKGLEEAVGEHFGRVETYTIVDEDMENVEVLPNTSNHRGGQRYPPEILADAGVEVLLCRGLGRKAIQMFSEKNIDVYCEASGSVEDAIKQWKNGKLVLASENTACSQHAFRSPLHEQGKCDKKE